MPLYFQLNTDCLDNLPLDYDLALGGVGAVGVLALEAVVSGASSDGTLSEGSSSVVLDPGVRRVGLPQDYQDPDTLRDSPVMASSDTHTGATSIAPFPPRLPFPYTLTGHFSRYTLPE